MPGLGVRARRGRRRSRQGYGIAALRSDAERALGRAPGEPEPFAAFTPVKSPQSRQEMRPAPRHFGRWATRSASALAPTGGVAVGREDRRAQFRRALAPVVSQSALTVSVHRRPGESCTIYWLVVALVALFAFRPWPWPRKLKRVMPSSGGLGYF